MNLRAGSFLKSTEALKDSFFAETTLFLKEYNADGAVGLVINRPFGRSLNELAEFSQSLFFPLYHGGPVDEEHLFFLHRRPDLIGGSTAVSNDVYWGGNFEQAVRFINQQVLTNNDIKIFVGYCGWDTGELEEEIAEGSWTTWQGDTESVFA
jgi:putative transcriptional regulator